MTATAPTGDLTAFLQKIHDDPDSDVPRLVFADWLDEHASDRTPCRCAQYTDDPANPWRGEPGFHPERDPASGRHEGGWTNCKTCNNAGGTPGWARDGNGYAERAELIRLQCRIASLDNRWGWACYQDARCNSGECEPCCLDSLRRRERELLAKYGGEWTRPLVEAFGMEGYDGTCLLRRFAERDGDYTILGHPVTFVRGLLHVEAPLDSLLDGLPRMGSGLLWVGSVRCTDRKPHFTNTSNLPFSWWDVSEWSGQERSESDLPHVLYVLLEGETNSVAPPNWIGYPTTDLAHAALSRAILTLCRERAGLTPPRTTTE